MAPTRCLAVGTTDQSMCGLPDQKTVRSLVVLSGMRRHALIVYAAACVTLAVYVP